MILTIGRVGLDVELSPPRDIDQSISAGGAEQVSISGHIKDTTNLANANVLRDELLAQVGQVIPVTLTIDPKIDGFYKLLSANVEVSSSLASLQSTGFFPFSISLERKHGAAFEIAFSGGLMPNSHSITTTINKGLVGIAVGTDLLWTQDPSGSIGTTDLESEDGAVRCFYQLDPADYGLRYSILPADFYSAACELSVNGALRAGVGRTFNSPNPVVLSNGQIRLTFNAADNGDVQIEHFADSAWETAKGYHFDTAHGNENGDWDECRVVRNDPEMVTIQLTKSRTTAGQGFLALNISIRRGWRVALFTFITDSADTLGVFRTASEAATALGSSVGIVATAADGGGNKFIIVSPNAHTATLAGNSGIALTSSGSRFTFGIGSVINSATPDTGANTQDLIDQFFNFLTVRQLLIYGVSGVF
jgi:hypothetical protein